MEGETNMNIEEQMITISFRRENFDDVISKLETLDALVQETVHLLKEARDHSSTRSQVF